jgi:osmotically-inducible protein OsmY
VKTDALIQADVISELKWDPSVDTRKIGVSVRDGIVTLNGNVNSFVEKLSAERVAGRVAGVRAIAQEIKVVLPQSYEHDDSDIAEAVVNALEWNVMVPHDRVKVTVQDGMVILTGEVDWAYQRDAAYEATCCLVGVKGITNQITVKPSASSEGIKTKIESALNRHSSLDARSLTVEAVGSKIILSGSVHSWIEKQEAESAAWAAPGVSNVENKITVSP